MWRDSQVSRCPDENITCFNFSIQYKVTRSIQIPVNTNDTNKSDFSNTYQVTN